MNEIITTREMELAPHRVPVMIQQKVANELAAYLLRHHLNEYDETLDRIIRAGLDATREDGSVFIDR